MKISSFDCSYLVCVRDSSLSALPITDASLTYISLSLFTSLSLLTMPVYNSHCADSQTSLVSLSCLFGLLLCLFCCFPAADLGTSAVALVRQISAAGFAAADFGTSVGPLMVPQLLLWCLCTSCCFAAANLVPQLWLWCCEPCTSAVAT